MQRRIRVLALATYPVQAPSTGFRLVQYIPPLSDRGIDVTFIPFLNAAQFAKLYQPKRLVRQLPGLALRTLTRLLQAYRAGRANVVLVQREAMLVGPPVVEWIAAKVFRRPMILDLDDATYLAVDSPVYGRMAALLKWPSKTDSLIRWSRVVTCGNDVIAEYVRSKGTPAVFLPSAVDTAVFRPRDGRGHGLPVLGWIGTHSAYPYFERLLPILEELARECPFRISVVGATRTPPVHGIEVEARPWVRELDAEYFRALDVGVYPIADDPWGAGKSGLKAVQYMSSAVPFVMSPVGVCATMGMPGVTHFNAVTDEQWLQALRKLLTDPKLRKRMGAAGRAFAEKHYSLDQQADRLASLIQAAASGERC